MNVKEALQVLENAAASDVNDVKQIFSSEYKHLKKAIAAHAPHAVWDELKHAKGAALDFTVDKAKDVDKSVHEHPWHYIGGAALLAGMIGFLFGRSTK
ncbi:MAG: hypothetical protein NTY22_05550 [Proteobacteria bacterium]|nr:hypothetical protein [Pseudomonadota bacterium]